MATPLDEGTLFSLRELLFGDLATANPEDVRRWYNQEFAFAEEEGATFGLKQRSGGPCGVLAAVQGYVLYRLVFGDDISKARDVERAFMHSISM